MAYWRDASTVILAAPSDHTEKLSQLNFDYEVLLLQRGSSLKFHSEFYVYPGGVVSDADSHPRWAELFVRKTGGSIQEISAALSCHSKFPPVLQSDSLCATPRNISMRITAIRETFEEAGIALLTNNLKNPSGYCIHEEFPLAEREHWRKAVIDDPAKFMDMCEHFDAVPDVWSLVEWSNWLTPVMNQVEAPLKKPRRFDTMFFLCCLNNKPEVAVDGVENTSFQVSKWNFVFATKMCMFDCVLQWNTPEGTLWRRSLGKITCGEPQAIETQRMYNFERFQDLNRFSIQRASNFDVQRCLVVLLACSDGVVALYPG
jgi:nucleoside diphosphate-linked moiety X motif protein 19